MAVAISSTNDLRVNKKAFRASWQNLRHVGAALVVAGLLVTSPVMVWAGKIGDYVWNDADGDGIQEDGETGLSGVTVNLQDCSGTNLSTMQTDEAGKYLFSGLVAGRYRIHFVAPAGWSFSLPKQTTGREDSNPDPGTGLTGCRPLADRQSRRGIDAGLISDNGPGVADHPNVLFILADDMGAETSSLYPSLAGDKGQVSSPTLEALAATGIVFENAWASPVCSPTRGSLISGEYGHMTNVTAGGDVLDPNTTTSIFEYISSDSPETYAMATFGKWHLGDNVAEHGIPVFKGLVEGGITNYFDWVYDDENGDLTNSTTYSTTALTDFAIEFIQDQQQNNPSQPWFVYLAYNAPHATSGDNGGFQVPPANLHTVDVGILKPGDIEDSIPVYQAMIQAMDTEIGRLLDAIGPLGSAHRDNTIVFFMSDNGTPPAVKDTNTGVRGTKSKIQEGGIKVPLIVSGAGVTRTNAREDAIVVSTDIYATIAELSGIAVTQVRDGFSIVPLLSDVNASSGREYGFTEQCSRRDRYTIRDNQYKLSYDNGTWELFDLINDPLEANNLYNNPSYANQQSVLEVELLSLQQNARGGCFQ